MASNSVPANFLPIFEGYWKQCDPQNSGKVMASDAAALLKTSQLKQSTLHRIWQLADSNARGFLDKQGFFTALKLVAVCQMGKEPSLANLSPSDPLPQLSAAAPSPAPVPALATAKPWVIESEDRKQFITMFNGLQPSSGKLSGAKARETFLKSGLPKDILSKIWTLADVDGDGALTSNEFAIAMYLIQRCRGGEPVPPTLPPSLKPATPPVSSPMHGSLTEPPAPPITAKWAITPEMKAKYDAYFSGIDKDKDGFVTGDESRGLFMASSLPQNVLANIWNMVDMKSIGKLNAEQFAVAMFLISEKVQGNEVPETLPPQLVPPSMRSIELDSAASKDASSSSSSFLLPFTNSSSSLMPVGNVGVGDTGGVVMPEMSFSSDFSAIRELDGFNTELETLTMEKERLQQEVKAQENELISAKDDVQVLKNSLQESQARCQELGAEKNEAQAKLDQLNAEKTSMEQQLLEARRSVEETKIAVEMLKEELQGKKEALKSQSDELQKLQVELQALKKEEAAMRLEVENDRVELQRVQQTVMDTKSQINRAQESVNALKDDQRNVNASLAMYSSISVGGGISTSGAGAKGSYEGGLGDLSEDQSQLRREADSVSARATAGSNSPMSSLSGLSEFVEENKDDNASKLQLDPFSSTSGEDPFSSIGGFSDDPFKTPTATTFGGSGGFPDPFAGMGGDPFKESSSLFGQQFQVAPALLSGDPFGSGDTTEDPFKVMPKLEVDGGDPFKVTPKLEVDGADPFKVTPKLEVDGADPFKVTPKLEVDGADPFKVTPKLEVDGADPFKVTASDGKDPFASTGSSFGGTAPPAAGGDPFGIPSSGGERAIGDPFGGGGGSHDDSKTPPSSDPFADPFGSDSFGSAGWSGDSLAATASTATGVSSSTPKGTKIPKNRSSEKEQMSWAYADSQKTLRRQQLKEEELRRKEEEDLARAIKESLKTAKK